MTTRSDSGSAAASQTFISDTAFFPTVNEDQLALVCAFIPLTIACRCAGMAPVDGQRAPVAQN
jgi:hypothetical protein